MTINYAVGTTKPTDIQIGRAAVHAVATKLYRFGLTVIDIDPTENLLTVKDGGGATITVRAHGRTKGNFQIRRVAAKQASNDRAWVFVNFEADIVNGTDRFYVVPGWEIEAQARDTMPEVDPYPHAAVYTEHVNVLLATPTRQEGEAQDQTTSFGPLWCVAHSMMLRGISDPDQFMEWMHGYDPPGRENVLRTELTVRGRSMTASPLNVSGVEYG
jgi:hypothetical protein